MRGAMSWSGSLDGLNFSGSGINLIYFTLLLWSSVSGMEGLSDFSNYLSRIITSHSAHACDGEHLRLHCPRHSTISIQSAFYGRASALLCSTDNATAAAERASNNSCSAFTTLQKLLSECQSHRDCQLPVNHLLFGPDPCPGTTKYLHVTYRCKPTEHKSRVVCEGETLTLHCRAPRVLLIYTGVYGRGLGQHQPCLSRPRGSTLFDCWNHDAVHTLSQICYSRQRCVVAVDDQTFRDPCYPGTRKYLTVLYTCVPQALLSEADPGVLLKKADQAHPGPPRSRPHPEDVTVHPEDNRRPLNTGVIISNSLMTFAFIKDHTEKAALLFTSSVCVGLLLTLLAVSVRVTCRGRCHAHRTHTSLDRPEEEEDDENDDEDELTNGSLQSDADRKLAYCWEDVSYASEEAAAAMIERVEKRDMVIQEIWMSSYYNILCSRQDPLLIT
ncbi:hypothetical protein UPYG_G00129080 [Umbra pygmaea]|uniref:SUEL-type lectin domain-containing protein n=1 Tax=Umbra pygmaea TaxID=75934 RepID=A0ABD0X6N3_UMBPY